MQLANEDGLIVMSAGAADACERGPDYIYDFAVQFDAGEYFVPIFEQVRNGELTEGQARVFMVGQDPQIGALFCDATAEQKAALDDLHQRVFAGEFDETLGAIAAEAFAG